ncbi:conserved Plasmodium protein, unknown function [Plasmodium sp. DRC-Itaito]|nr:conserved Plasmodium protein, unknown function [Plasmodium sp. DRC-Itaito]
MSLFKVKREETNITYHEQIYTYKNVEKYDEDIIDIDKKFLKVPNRNLEILKRINIYSKYDKNEETNNRIINKRRRSIHNKIYSNNLIDDIKYMDILICGDKNSGKTTFLNCIGCTDNNCLENKCEYFKKDKKDKIKNKYHNNNNNNNKEKINIKKSTNNTLYNNFNNNEKYSNNICNINYNTKKKKNQKVIWNDNKLQLLSYIPIIFSKLINRNYEQFRKSFKKNFLDTDICEMSIFITRDDLSFINYEFNISNDFCTKHYFNYIKINFCEYGEDFFHKIKKYYKIYYYKKNNYILHKQMKEQKKKEKLPLLYSPRIVNMIESALFRIREIKYINFFINLKKSFILVKCTTRLYNILIKKRYNKSNVLKIGSCRNLKRTINNILFYKRNIHILNNYLHIKCDNKQFLASYIKYKQNKNIKIKKKKQKKKKKKPFCWILKTFENINIIKNLNNYNMKDILFFASRSFNYEKLSKKYYIFFNLTYNMNIINNIINKSKKYNLQILYYLIKIFVHKNWKIYKHKEKKNKTNMFTEMIFKYYPNKKKNIYNTTHKNNIYNTTHKNNIYNTTHKNNIYNTTHKNNIYNTTHKNNIYNTTHKNNIYNTTHKNNIYNTTHKNNIYNTTHKNNIYNTTHKNNIYISSKQEDMINFLKCDKLEIHNFFKIFYDEYIYKNQNKSYVKLLEGEHFDLCFLFMKLYFYYHFYINKVKEENTTLCRKADPKLNFQNFIYLKQIEIEKKNDGSITYNNICVPSCVYSFINLLKMYYKNYPFFTLKKNNILFLVNIIFSSIAYYKLKKKSCDFLFSSNKWRANYICYFDKAVIINSIVNLLEKKNEHDENEVNKNIKKKQDYTNKYIFSYCGKKKKDEKEKNKKLHSIWSCAYYKKYKRRRKILQGIVKNVDINNIPPYIIINNIKTNWLYIKKYMINLNMCSYHNQYMFTYPSISYDIILYFNDNKKHLSFHMNEENNFPKISFKPIYKNTYTHIKKNYDKKKKKNILHFPFNHKVLKYFSDIIQMTNDNKENVLLLQYLYVNFSKELANLLTYINKEKYKNQHKRINLLVRNNIFILLNYVMDIYYIMEYTYRGRKKKKKVKLNEKKIYITINNSNDTYINEKNIQNNSLIEKEEKKITFHIYKNDPLFNSIYFLWEDLKINETQKPLINTYLEHLREHLYFSIYA